MSIKMERKLIIIGAGTYGVVVHEIASDMGCFEKIDFVDDNRIKTPTGKDIVGKINDLKLMQEEYTDAIVAIGNPNMRLELLDLIKKNTFMNIATIISPKAYVSNSAVIHEGVVVEPYAVIQALCQINRGCFISAGAVVNHESYCGEGVHLDCNSTVNGYANVPPKFKLLSGTVF